MPRAGGCIRRDGAAAAVQVLSSPVGRQTCRHVGAGDAQRLVLSASLPGRHALVAVQSQSASWGAGNALHLSHAVALSTLLNICWCDAG